MIEDFFRKEFRHPAAGGANMFAPLPPMAAAAPAPAPDPAAFNPFNAPAPAAAPAAGLAQGHFGAQEVPLGPPKPEDPVAAAKKARAAKEAANKKAFINAPIGRGGEVLDNRRAVGFPGLTPMEIAGIQRRTAITGGLDDTIAGKRRAAYERKKEEWEEKRRREKEEWEERRRKRLAP